MIRELTESDFTKTKDLYDLRQADFPMRKNFRMLQVHACVVCRAQSNLAYWKPGTRWSPAEASFSCKNKDKDWHALIEDKLELLQHPHPASYLEMLKQEIETIRKQQCKEDDLEGEFDTSQTADYRGGYLIVNGVYAVRPGFKSEL